MKNSKDEFLHLVDTYSELIEPATSLQDDLFCECHCVTKEEVQLLLKNGSIASLEEGREKNYFGRGCGKCLH
jgi:NAD(P)H-nitrite reductase large subunit